MTEPTYEELMGPKQTIGLAAHLRSMEPGEIWDVPLGGRTIKQFQNGCAATFFRITGAKFATRTRDGRLYVIRLRDEDMQNGHGS